MKNDNFLIQFISHKDGMRSQPFQATRDELYDLLKDREDIDSEDLILVVARLGTLPGQTQIENLPIITIKQWLEFTRTARNELTEEEIENV